MKGVTERYDHFPTAVRQPHLCALSDSSVEVHDEMMCVLKASEVSVSLTFLMKRHDA